MTEIRLRIVCGEHAVEVYPRRFDAVFTALLRPILGKGPRTAWYEFRGATYYELDQVAEMILVGCLQAGMAMTLAEAQQHPIILRWDEDGGTTTVEAVPVEGLAETVAAADMEEAPDPL